MTFEQIWGKFLFFRLLFFIIRIIFFKGGPKKISISNRKNFFDESCSKLLNFDFAVIFLGLIALRLTPELSHSQNESALQPKNHRKNDLRESFDAKVP